MNPYGYRRCASCRKRFLVWHTQTQCPNRVTCFGTLEGPKQLELFGGGR